ncbi:MAG: HD domain-containing protein [Lachnospiraceae bacterium]|nr:HD domain-containing protein [Lachnospiraceae bacterium]
MTERLKKQMDFILEIDRLKKITRQTYISDASRFENDTEHSWHLAMMCMLLSEHAGGNVDMLKVMKMVLIHDIVEIDAGDTYAYDEAANATKRERELKAADRIFGLLPDDQGKELRTLWDEFEEWQTEEAKFAHTLDNIQPIMLNAATDGLAWRNHSVHKNQIMKRNERTAEGSEVLWEYGISLIEENIDKGNIKE